MLAKCPKCHSNGIFYDRVLGYNRNTCLICGTMHQPGTEFQALERQVTGMNTITGCGDWKAQIEAGWITPDEAPIVKKSRKKLNFEREAINASK